MDTYMSFLQDTKYDKKSHFFRLTLMHVIRHVILIKVEIVRKRCCFK